MRLSASRTTLAVALAASLGAASHAVADEPPLVPRPEDKCPVCGMFVARYPEWVAGVRFGDGQYAVFDGAKDLFEFLLGAKRDGRGHTAKDVRSTFVTDYYAVKQVEAQGAWFVLGSDVLGPMGHELVPFGDERAAREFLADHKGKRLLRFRDVTAALLKDLQ